ncbi:glycosyltransferase [Metabacillus litoralis]|uniref:glycosyltransferase n=1 Tax=Metabacillus litoralis TaxID=152268 RepID=UPI00203D65FA|nr:glycosyltransferase [Metabacillus litoralis]MCM3650417.1 glycosyltransferase [Metabacillus litoralis]
MKKIVIVTRRMIMGGIEKALISMLESIPKDEYSVTVLVMGNGGELIDDVPNHVEIKCIYGNERSTLEKLWSFTKKGRLFDVVKTVWYTTLAKRAKTVYHQEMYHSKMLSILEEEYDIAIAYHTPASFPVIYVMNNIKAKIKTAWIHSDVSIYKRELNSYKELYLKYDKIFCVSKFGVEKFVEMFPDLKEKTSVFYNILDKKKLKLLSTRDEGFIDNYDGIRILTVGRLTEEKGQDLIPFILTKLKSAGHNVRWYCIGDGENRLMLENLIRKHKLEEHLILLGTKKNPYAYVKQCDIYVQPSKHEGYCITLAEARVFNKPILVTDFVGAREQIIDGKTGMIVNFDESEIYNKLVNFLENRDVLQQLERNLANEDSDNNSEIEQLLSLI